MKIALLGAGAWGTALAVAAAQHPAHQVTLWARDAAQAAAMAATHSNAQYLPGVTLPSALALRADTLQNLPRFAATQDLLVIATPVAGLRSMLEALYGVAVPIVWLCKGFLSEKFEETLDLLPHELHAKFAMNPLANNGVNPYVDGSPPHFGVLSGPSFAAEVARQQPTALVAASPNPAVTQALVSAFHSPTLRIYTSDDVVGVEVGGAVKNVLAIATGLCDGLNLGLNARAALITRGLSEMTRLGLALGAKAETFMGLSGLGDLVLTATGDLSRNRKVGLLLAQGHTLAQAVASLGHVAEGVYCARTVVQRAHSLGVDMPIAQNVVRLLDGHCTAHEAVAALMGRGATSEK